MMTHTPQDLRRTCRSWLAKAGVGIERVSELLRHGDVAITARVYAHLRTQDIAETVAVLDKRNQVSRSSCTLAQRPTEEGDKPAATG